MDNLTRLHYLQALGIDVWLPKNTLGDSSSPENLSGQQAIDLGSTDVVAQPSHSESACFQCAPLALSNNDTWATLQAEVAACTRCGLCATRTQTVFGSGNQQADWMVIGEAPGQHEDEQGLPFVGNAGLLLTEMLRAIGLSREQDVFIANILKCRPPHNRDPQPEEAESCNEYLQRQFALVQPKIILAVGRIAAQTLLRTDAPIGRLRGKAHTFNQVPVVVIYHPAYLLRSPLEKRKAWLDLQLAIQTLKNRQG